MSQFSIVGISGNVARPSRTATLVTVLVEALAHRLGGSASRIELADAGPSLLRALTPDQLDEQGRAILRQVEEADLLVVASPVYRGAYTGAFKHLFDLIDQRALARVPVVLAATGGSPLHALVIEHQLRPLFGFFGALSLPTTLYATPEDIVEQELVNPALKARIARVAEEAEDWLHGRGASQLSRQLPRLVAG